MLEFNQTHLLPINFAQSPPTKTAGEPQSMSTACFLRQEGDDCSSVQTNFDLMSVHGEPKFEP